MSTADLQRPGISQPPHSAGRRFQGLRSLVDPSQIPSAVSQAAEDQAKWRGRVYYTCEPDIDIPLAGTECTFVDQGDSTEHTPVPAFH